MKRGELSFKGLGVLLFLAISVYFLMPGGDLFASMFDLNVYISPVGTGSVKSSDTYIDCPGDCYESYMGGTSVTLTAYPDPGYVFSHWSGDLSGSTNPDAILIAGPKSVTAVFTLLPPTNRPPVISPLADKTINEGVLLTFTASATDPDGDPLTYLAMWLPPGASFSSTGTFSWQPDFTQAGTYQVTLWVQDDRGGSDSETVTITVLDANPNRPPVLAPIGNKSINEGALLTFSVSATDPDGDSLTYSVAGLPAGASFAVRTFSWQPDLTQAGTYRVTFSVTDGQETDSETITITVIDVTQNHPPDLAPIGNKSINAGELLTFSVSATDPDGDQLTFSANGLPQGANFNSATRIFEWTPTVNQIGTYQVTFQVSDGELSDSEAVTIEVTTAAPELPDPFPYDQVGPSQGQAGVDPENACFLWPEAVNAATYDFLLSRDQEFSSVDIAMEGLTELLYCIGTATTSLTIAGVSEPSPHVGAPTASRTEEGLEYCQSYFWKIIAHNIFGEVAYPVFGFFTQMLEGSELESPQPLGSLEYQMISIPLHPENPSPVAVLGDDLGPYNASVWRLFRYDSSDGQNHEYPGVPDMNPGHAYWLIVREGVTIDAQGSPVDTETEFVIQIPPGFFQLGSPFPFPVSWEEVKVRKGIITVPIGDPANIWISSNLWKYENGGYVLTDMLEPWKGYWVENVSNEAVELLIPPKMFVEEVAEE